MGYFIRKIVTHPALALLNKTLGANFNWDEVYQLPGEFISDPTSENSS